MVPDIFKITDGDTALFEYFIMEAEMADNNPENKTQTGTNCGGTGPTYQDWREQRPGMAPKT